MVDLMSLDPSDLSLNTMADGSRELTSFQIVHFYFLCTPWIVDHQSSARLSLRHDADDPSYLRLLLRSSRALRRGAFADRHAQPRTPHGRIVDAATAPCTIKTCTGTTMKPTRGKADAG
jgi:hypothetical protein